MPRRSRGMQYLDVLRSRHRHGHFFARLLEDYFSGAGAGVAQEVQCLEFQHDRVVTKDADAVSDNPQVFVLRGHLSPSRVDEVATRMLVLPEFLVRHLDLSSVSPGNQTAHGFPPLHKSHDEQLHVHIRFTCLGTIAGSTSRDDFSDLPEQRLRCRETTRRFDARLRAHRQYGETVFRDVNLHNTRHFSVEQVVSLCVLRSRDQTAPHPWSGKSHVQQIYLIVALTVDSVDPDRRRAEPE